uniref:Non-specific serine/threonine protein kinase n=1 Tax=Fagus sylvatica TaxID=28930 RepID=A0A2N9J640_FAGSY
MSLTANDEVPSWLSPSGDFAFGFHQLDNKEQFLLSIWYANIPDKTVVWYANGDNPAPRGSKVELRADGGLVLNDPQGKEIWRSEPIIGSVAYGVMNDTGNFVLESSNSNKLWQSFDYPTDTMLPTQTMMRGGVLSSRKSATNFSTGRFQFRLLNDGNLVLNTINLDTKLAYDAYYISDTYDGSNSSNSGYQVIFNESGYMYILIQNGQRSPLTPGKTVPATDFYHRATLDFDGVFAQYYHPKMSSNNGNWDFNESCEEDEDSVEDLYDFLMLIDTDWPSSDYEELNPFNEEECKKSCLHDCMCATAIHRGDSCWKKKLPLSNGRVDSSVNGKAFIKFRKGTVPSQNPPHSNPFPKKDKKGNSPAGSVLLVKKLDRVVEKREKEFRTEVDVIGQTHHKNLVQLIGFCDEGQHRLLVYKFMSNGTLASFLFGGSTPSWNIRTQIAVGIARGLLYLHEECGTQIIHCDIKPENVLLDDYYNARISDFGLAKLLMMDQSQTLTTIRGTRGYVAPEWFRSTPITLKVDVYSFGVLLLEIICCRRCVDAEMHMGEIAVLTDWACDCYQGGMLNALVEDDMEAMNDIMNLERFVKLAIWCIQEDPSLRPTMRKRSLLNK